MKRLLLALTILTASVTGIAGEQEDRAINAIETVLIMKAKNIAQPYIKPTIKKVVTRLNNRFGNDGNPSATVKSIAAALKGVKELVNPDVTFETRETKTRVRVLEFKTLKINFNSKKSDLKFNFETNGKDAKFGLGMSF